MWEYVLVRALPDVLFSTLFRPTPHKTDVFITTAGVCCEKRRFMKQLFGLLDRHPDEPPLSALEDAGLVFLLLALLPPLGEATLLLDVLD